MDKKVKQSQVSAAKMRKTLSEGSQLMTDNLNAVFKSIEERLASIPDDLPIKGRLQELLNSSK